MRLGPNSTVMRAGTIALGLVWFFGGSVLAMSEKNITIIRKDNTTTHALVTNEVVNSTYIQNIREMLTSSPQEHQERWNRIDARLADKKSKVTRTHGKLPKKNSQNDNPGELTVVPNASNCVAATAPPNKRSIVSRGDRFPESDALCALDCGNGINYREVSAFLDDVLHGSSGEISNNVIRHNGGMFTISPTNGHFVLIQFNIGPNDVKLGELSFGGALIPVNGECTQHQTFGGFTETRDQQQYWLVTSTEVLADLRGSGMNKFASCVRNGRSGNARIANDRSKLVAKGEAEFETRLLRPQLNASGINGINKRYIHEYAGCGVNCGNRMDYADCSSFVELATAQARDRSNLVSSLAPLTYYRDTYGACTVVVVNQDEELEVTVPYNSLAADHLIVSNYIGEYSLGGGGLEQAPGLRCTEFLVGEADRVDPAGGAYEGCLAHANSNNGECY